MFERILISERGAGKAGPSAVGAAGCKGLGMGDRVEADRRRQPDFLARGLLGRPLAGILVSVDRSFAVLPEACFHDREWIQPDGR